MSQRTSASLAERLVILDAPNLYAAFGSKEGLLKRSTIQDLEECLARLP